VFTVSAQVRIASVPHDKTGGARAEQAAAHTSEQAKAGAQVAHDAAGDGAAVKADADGQALALLAVIAFGVHAASRPHLCCGGGFMHVQREPQRRSGMISALGQHARNSHVRITDRLNLGQQKRGRVSWQAIK